MKTVYLMSLLGASLMLTFCAVGRKSQERELEGGDIKKVTDNKGKPNTYWQTYDENGNPYVHHHRGPGRRHNTYMQGVDADGNPYTYWQTYDENGNPYVHHHRGPGRRHNIYHNTYEHIHPAE